MGLEFYYDLLSQPSRAVYIFLKAAGVPFQANAIALRKGEHLKPDYLKKSPFHKVPFIIDDGFSLSESVAIMRYVAGKYKVAEHWFPTKDSAKNARAIEFLCWHQMAIRKPCVTVFLDVVQSKIDGFFGRPKRPANEKTLTEAKAEVKKGVSHISDYFLKGGKKFVTGDEVSVADLLIVCELRQLNGVNEQGLYESDPVVKAWVKRVEEAYGPHFQEGHADITDVEKQFNAAK